jgi:hypothetical protein
MIISFSSLQEQHFRRELQETYYRIYYQHYISLDAIEDPFDVEGSRAPFSNVCVSFTGLQPTAQPVQHQDAPAGSSLPQPIPTLVSRNILLLKRKQWSAFLARGGNAPIRLQGDPPSTELICK